LQTKTVQKLFDEKGHKYRIKNIKSVFFISKFCNNHIWSRAFLLGKSQFLFLSNLHFESDKT